MKNLKFKIAIAVLMGFLLISPSKTIGQLTMPHTENFNSFDAGGFVSGTNDWTDASGTSTNLCIYLSAYWGSHDGSQPIILRNRNSSLTTPTAKWTVNLVSPEIVVSGANPVVSWVEASYSRYNTVNTNNSSRKLFIKSITGTTWVQLISYTSSSPPDLWVTGGPWSIRTEIIPTNYVGQTVQFKWECQSDNNEYVYWLLDNIYVGTNGPVFDIKGLTAHNEVDFHTKPYMDLTQSKRILTVTNIGQGDLIVGQPYLTNPSGSVFTLDPNPGGTITGVPGQQTPDGIDFKVSFDPLSSGSYSSILNIPYSINGLNYASTITLKGVGIDCSDAIEIVQAYAAVIPDIETAGYQGQLYKYTAQFPQELIINSCYSCQPGSHPGDYAWDTYLRVFLECPTIPEDQFALAYNDDMEEVLCSYNRHASQVSLTLAPCQTIYIYWPLEFITAEHSMDEFLFRMIITPIGTPPFNLVLGNTHVYYGYTNDYNTTELTATSGGTPPFTYLWSTGESTQLISVMPPVTTTYTVLVTDINGCSVAEEITVNVEDVKMYDQNGNIVMAGNEPKIKICHHCGEIGIASSGVSGHLNNHSGSPHYDHLGVCTGFEPCNSPGNLIDGFDIDVYPNPSDGVFSVRINPIERSTVRIELRSIIGTTIYQEEFAGNEGQILREIDLGILSKGIYFILVKNGNQSVVKKLIVN